MINELPKVVQDYEAGKAMPNQQARNQSHRPGLPLTRPADYHQDGARAGGPAAAEEEVGWEPGGLKKEHRGQIYHWRGARLTR